MNIFKKLFSKKKIEENITTDNIYQNSFAGGNYQSDETVKLNNSNDCDPLTQLLSKLQDIDDSTVPLTNFEFEDFGETVLRSNDDCITSDETVLLNNSNCEEESKSNNSSKSFSLDSAFLINPLSGEKVNIDKQIFTIGSGYDVDCKIDKPGVSSNHATIFIKGVGEYYIVDNGSTNGSQVDGAVIEPMKMISIDNGDLITFGNELYQFYIEE